jgi:hypothetical protein
MGEGNTAVEAPAFRPGRTSTEMFATPIKEALKNVMELGKGCRGEPGGAAR